MAIRRNSTSMKRSPLRRSGSTSIKKVGPRALAWKACRSEKIETDIDEEGLIRCEDYKLGLPRCGIARLPEEMDLHHSKGRDGDLLTDKRWLVWLTRDCHSEAHNPDSSSSSSQTKDDTER